MPKVVNYQDIIEVGGQTRTRSIDNLSLLRDDDFALPFGIEINGSLAISLSLEDAKKFHEALGRALNTPAEALEGDTILAPVDPSEFKAGDDVIVSEPPHPHCSWGCSFEGTIEAVKEDLPANDGSWYATVIDQEDQAFDVPLEFLNHT